MKIKTRPLGPKLHVPMLVCFFLRPLIEKGLGFLGIFFNVIAITVLSDKDMINSFNMMLTLLCGIDTGERQL